MATGRLQDTLEYWFDMPLWELHQAVIICLGEAPLDFQDQEHGEIYENVSDSAEFRLAVEAINDGELSATKGQQQMWSQNTEVTKVKPVEMLSWWHSKHSLRKLSEELLLFLEANKSRIANSVSEPDLLVSKKTDELETEIPIKLRGEQELGIWKIQTKIPHGNEELYASVREKILGAALDVINENEKTIFKPGGGLNAAKICRIIIDRSLIYWPDHEDPVAVEETITRLLRKWINSSKKKEPKKIT